MPILQIDMRGFVKLFKANKIRYLGLNLTLEKMTEMAHSLRGTISLWTLQRYSMHISSKSHSITSKNALTDRVLTVLSTGNLRISKFLEYLWKVIE